jgi:transposase
MRKSIDGLAAATRTVLGRDPCSGDLFVFCNLRRNRMKFLFWEDSGFWLALKRLERGTFNWPARGDAREVEIEMTQSELTALIDGLDIHVVRRRLRFSRTTMIEDFQSFAARAT